MVLILSYHLMLISKFCAFSSSFNDISVIILFDNNNKVTLNWTFLLFICITCIVKSPKYLCCPIVKNYHSAFILVSNYSECYIKTRFCYCFIVDCFVFNPVPLSLDNNLITTYYCLLIPNYFLFTECYCLISNPKNNFVH